MGFRFRQKDGKDGFAKDLQALEAALGAGAIGGDTAILDEEVNKRLPAAALIAFRRKQAAATRQPPPAKVVKGDQPRDDRGVRRHQTIAFAVAVASTLALVPFGLRPEQVSDLATAAIVVMVVLLAIAALVLGRETPRQRARLAWIAAAVWSLFMLSPIAFMLATQKERAASDRVALKAMAEAARTGGASPAAQGVDERTIMGKMVPLQRKYQAEFARLSHDFQAFEATVDMEAVVTPAVLATDAGRAKNLDTVARYTAALERQRKLELETHARFRGEVGSVVANASNAGEILTAVDAAQARRRALDDESHSNNLELMHQMRALNDYVAARQATLVLREGKIVFPTDADVQGYRRITAEIRRIGEAEEALDRRREEAVRAGAERIEKEAAK